MNTVWYTVKTVNNQVCFVFSKKIMNYVDRSVTGVFPQEVLKGVI